MTAEMMERELDQIHAEISSAVTKLDSVIRSMSAHGERLGRTEVQQLGIEGSLHRIEKNLDSMHDDLFGDAGLSQRVRKAEQVLIHHSIIVKAVSVIIGLLLIGTVQHVFFGSVEVKAAQAMEHH